MDESVEDFEHINGDGPTSLGSISSRRTSSIVGDADAGPTDSELLRILECPVCTEFPVPPIYNCANGHFTCNECINLLQICTLCESPFTHVRNFALEAIIEKTKFKCRNASQGCHELVTGETYKTHMANCLYGPLLCNEKQSIACDRRNFDTNDYLEHLINCHNACGQSVSIGRPIIADFIQKKGDSFSPIYFKCQEGEEIFILNTKKHKSFICWWVSCLNPISVKSYKAKLTWSKTNTDQADEKMSRNDNENDFGLQWTMPIHPPNKPFDEIRDEGLCAVLPESHLSQFVNSSDSSEGEWNISFEVIKKGFQIEAEPVQALPERDTESFNLNQFMDTLRYYFPLIVIILMAITMCLLYGLSFKLAEDGKSSVGKVPDDYYGYRGFYYHGDHPYQDSKKPVVKGREQKFGKQKRPSSFPNDGSGENENDEYVGYRGFYQKHEGENKEREPTSLVRKIFTKIFNQILRTLNALLFSKSSKVSPHDKNKVLYDSYGFDIVAKFFGKMFMFLFSLFSVIAVLICLTLYRKWLSRNPTNRDRRDRIRTHFNEDSNSDDSGSDVPYRRQRPYFRGRAVLTSNVRFRNINDPTF